MIETLTNLKNNKLKQSGGHSPGADSVTRLRKFLNGLSKKHHGESDAPLLPQLGGQAGALLCLVFVSLSLLTRTYQCQFSRPSCSRQERQMVASWICLGRRPSRRTRTYEEAIEPSTTWEDPSTCPICVTDGGFPIPIGENTRDEHRSAEEYLRGTHEQ